MRYNAGDWKTMQYGIDLKEREKGMIRTVIPQLSLGQTTVES